MIGALYDATSAEAAKLRAIVLATVALTAGRGDLPALEAAMKAAARPDVPPRVASSGAGAANQQRRTSQTSNGARRELPPPGALARARAIEIRSLAASVAWTWGALRRAQDGARSRELDGAPKLAAPMLELAAATLGAAAALDPLCATICSAWTRPWLLSGLAPAPDRCRRQHCSGTEGRMNACMKPALIFLYGSEI
ncbi:MAG: hypothetical protein WDN04_14920, partial [Rhodospirillales bacterium]